MAYGTVMEETMDKDKMLDYFNDREATLFRDELGSNARYQLSSFVEKEDASLNFFMTMIIPLLIDDVGTIQGAVTFLIIVVMMCALLSKTHLYYANPVLAILGYRVYEVTFKSNPDFNNEVCLAVVKGGFLKNPSTVEYKVINDTVLYMKEMNK
jgi:hypothetical protein